MEIRRRTLVKSLTYRALSIFITILFTIFVMRMKPDQAIALSAGLHAILMLNYYAHERIWMKVPWGLSGNQGMVCASNLSENQKIQG